MCEICVYNSSLHVTVLHVMDVFLVTALLLFRLCDSRESRHRQRAQLPWNKTMAVFNTEQTNRSIRRSRRQREAAAATCYMSLNVKIQNRRCGSAAAQEQKEQYPYITGRVQQQDYDCKQRLLWEEASHQDVNVAPSRMIAALFVWTTGRRKWHTLSKSKWQHARKQCFSCSGMNSSGPAVWQSSSTKIAHEGSLMAVFMEAQRSQMQTKWAGRIVETHRNFQTAPICLRKTVQPTQHNNMWTSHIKHTVYISSAAGSALTGSDNKWT